jgi:hypothetical protein
VAPEAADALGGHPVVVVEDVAPGPIAGAAQALGGADDVGEEHGGEHPVGWGLGRLHAQTMSMGPSPHTV